MMFIQLIIIKVLVSVVFSKIVRIDQGILNGTILISRGGEEFHAFYGIPYAAAPVGLLRFASPATPIHWSGIRKADSRPLICLQTTPAIPGIRKANYAGSEDCLYINVFTKDITPKKLQPVLVYLHGGGFRSSSGDMNGPDLLMDKHIVFVSFNHRLGFFGYLSASDNVIPGNYGLKDQVMALKWIQQNINRFGGDPKLVTLMGQNSGATSAHLHTFSSLSKGLFHNVIVQSGNAVKYSMSDEVLKTRDAYIVALEKTNCNKSNTEESLACLRTLPGSYLNKIANTITSKNKFEIRYQPVMENLNVNGAFLRRTDFQTSAIPAIFGFNSAEGLNEAATYMKMHPNMSTLDEKLNADLPFMLESVGLKPKNISDTINRIKIFYFANGRMEAGEEQNLCNLIGDIFRTMTMIQAMVTYPGKKFIYIYDHRNKVTPTRGLFNDTTDFRIKGAGHSDELLTLFSTSVSDKLSIEDRKLSEKMITYWTNFVKSGNPNKPENVDIEWNAPMGLELQYLHITNNGFSMKSNPLTKRLKFWTSLLKLFDV